MAYDPTLRAHQEWLGYIQPVVRSSLREDPARRTPAARLRHQACLEDIDWSAPRGLDRSVILSLGTCAFIAGAYKVHMTGKSMRDPAARSSADRTAPKRE